MTGRAAPTPLVRSRRGVLTHLRAYLMAGMVVVAPLGVTFYVAWALIRWIDGIVGAALPAYLDPRTYLPFGMPGLGVVAVVAGVTLIGWLTANLVGRRVVALGERIVHRLPILRTIHIGAKQVVAVLIADDATAFRQVVTLEYPKRGVWVVGFVAARSPAEIERRCGGEFLSVFVPTTPNPATGFLQFVPREDARPTGLSVEQGVTLVISGGVIGPDAMAPGAPDGGR